MNWILTCVSIAFIVYLIYNCVAVKMFGVPKSLSMTYYLFEEKKKKLGIVFPIMMLGIAFLLLPAWLEISALSNLQFTAFLAAGGIMFTGAAPAFQSSSLEKKVHTGSAVVAAIFATLWVIFVANMWYMIALWLIIILSTAFASCTFKSSYIYWFETVAFMATFTSILAFLI